MVQKETIVIQKEPDNVCNRHIVPPGYGGCIIFKTKCAMEKVEQRALELFPVKYVTNEDDCLLPISDANLELREAYIRGWKDALAGRKDV